MRLSEINPPGIASIQMLCILIVVTLSSANTTHSACLDSARVREIAPGNYLRPGNPGVIFEQQNIANIGFIVGEQCIAVVDTGGSPTEGEALHCAIKKVSSLPVCVVVNTHVHPDHVLGNQAFEASEPRYVGHGNLPRALSLLGNTYIERLLAQEPHQKVSMDSSAFKIETVSEIDLGNRLIQLISVSQSHTDNDMMVLDRSTGTLWGGDIFFSEHVPVLGGSGSISGWLETLADQDMTSASLIIPGHGPLQHNTETLVTRQRDYLSTLRTGVRDAIEQGQDIGPAVEQVGQSARGSWQMFDHFHKRNVSYAYTELEWE